MGLRSMIRALLGRSSSSRGHADKTARTTVQPPREPEIAPGYPARDWEEIPAYLPVDPAEHREAVIIATAIAAADKPESSFSVKHVSMANPEYRRVACIATALGAGALPESSFVVKHVYRQKSLEETHAA
ncbi:hypothetical protein [Collinsella sp. An307]|uniref:hypothetical protein n=1 Tax=Collinsella sp. An307 TaxID=1965630 RepID=UPI000B39590C|nr:hypothetical protein [Collinsella sp. An307]OUO21331.1 hypothetical protein B5F89_04165 [Collinsella sp. An307]